VAETNVGGPSIHKKPSVVRKYPGMPHTISVEKVELNDHEKLMRDYKERIGN
jgi:hypothetical protein